VRRLALRSLALVLLTILALAPAGVSGDEPERIAYARLLDGGGADIFTANPDGSDEQLVPLVHPAEDFTIPVWSPDGSHLLISHSMRFDGNGDFLPWRPAIVRPDGSDYRLLEILDGPQDMDCLAWSGDGSRIFCALGEPETGIFSIRASDGGDRRRLTTPPFVNGGDLPVDVSPDGSELLFIRKKPGPAPDPQPFLMEQFALFVLDLNTGNERQLVPYGMTQGHEIQSAHWSPDGSTIISTNTHGRLFTVPADGGPIRFVKLEVRGFAFEPNWSPDGSRVLFGLFGPDQQDLYTADPDGSNVERVTETPDFENGPDWR
jgi:Tol biopolymer transport system component